MSAPRALAVDTSPRVRDHRPHPDDKQTEKDLLDLLNAGDLAGARAVHEFDAAPASLL